MRRITVAFKTLMVASFHHGLIRHTGSVAEEGGMTAEAVLLYNLLSRLPDIDSLWFFAQCEYCGVAETVTGLEVVFSDKAVMRHMTGIAVGDAAVCAVRPCGKLGCHNVTVDTDPRIIGEVGGGIGYLQQEEEKPRKGPENNYHRSSPLWGRSEETDKFIWSAHGSCPLLAGFTKCFILPAPPAADDYVKLTKHRATRAVPYRLSIVKDSLITVGSPR